MLFLGEIPSSSRVDASVLVDLFLEKSSRRPPLDWRREIDEGGREGSDRDVISTRFSRKTVGLLEGPAGRGGGGDIAFWLLFRLIKTEGIKERLIGLGA